jgi:thioredoxin reductase
VGAAAAGCTAAVYAARRHLKFIVVSKDIGGEVLLCGEVENWPGTIHTTGGELADNFRKHMMSYEPEIALGFGVDGIEQEGNVHLVHTSKGEEKRTIKTKAVIVGTGIHPKHIGIPGEAELRGRGVTYCTVCDGPLYRKKITTTIGAGSAALESALMMSEIADHVHLVTRYPSTADGKGGFPKGETILLEKVLQKENITIHYNANTTHINGERVVESITYVDKDSGEATTVPTHGVMIHIGTIPNSSFIDGVEKNANGELIIDPQCATSAEGIFAAGDVTSVSHKQIAIAAGQGATAALSAIEYINKWQPAA